MQTITLEPHDPLPEGAARRVVLLRRFDEDVPGTTHLELRLEGGGKPAEFAQPSDSAGHPMAWEAAIDAARRVAESEKLAVFYVLDRTAGPREQVVLEHHGDHSADMAKLEDTDPEDGETGSDMRDRRV